MNIFQDSEGNYSSKRALGIIYMLSALLLAIVDQLTKFEINSFEVWLTLVVTGGSLLGITLFEAKIKKGSKTPVRMGALNTLEVDNSGGHPDPKKEEK